MGIIGWEAHNEWALLDVKQVRNEMTSVNKRSLDLGRDTLMHKYQFCMDGHIVTTDSYYIQCCSTYTRVCRTQFTSSIISDLSISRSTHINSIMSSLTQPWSPIIGSSSKTFVPRIVTYYRMRDVCISM